MHSRGHVEGPASIRTLIYTTTAMVAFAANSLLCRMALRASAIDFASFSAIRFFSGAVMLALIVLRTERRLLPLGGSWVAAGVLAVYALPFAFAYTELSTGTGALIMFGCVQVTMLIAALVSGERLHPLQWVGLCVAVGGLVNLVFPGLTAPSPIPAGLMAIAGICWGVYSLLGRASSNPLLQTTGNFVRTTPLIASGSLLLLPRIHLEPGGIALAIVSGALASGLGYVVWYAALRGLTAARASVVQLAVPVLASAGGVMLLSETLTARLVLSAVLVLGGIAMAIGGGSKVRRSEGPRVRGSEGPE